MSNTLQRRTFLRAGGVALALPLLDSFLTSGVRASEPEPPRRMVFICTSLGLHAPFLFPKETGREYELTPYLKILAEQRDKFTIFSGLSHPDQAGADGHSSESTWLTASKHPGIGGFRDSMSIDQLVAERLGYVTRFPSLTLGTNATSQSYTRSGVMIHGDYKPSHLFAKLFLGGTKDQIAQQVERLREGRSIMDAVREEAQQFGNRLGSADRVKLDEYFSSVRDMELKLAKAEEWAHTPKPVVDAKPPTDIDNESDIIGRMRLMFELIPLALQTDSTRVITMLVQGRGDVPPVPGVSIDHHNLSHHGQDEEKIKQLRLIEEAEFKAFADLLAALRRKEEAGRTLLDHSLVLFGSNLGNANSHDVNNLPILLAGGRFHHAGHLAFDAKKNVPLSNLFVQMLNHCGHEVESFGSSTSGSVEGLS